MATGLTARLDSSRLCQFRAWLYCLSQQSGGRTATGELVSGREPAISPVPDAQSWVTGVTITGDRHV